MKWKWSLLMFALIAVIIPFFIQVYPDPPTVSFDYFLRTLEHIEDSLNSAGMNLEGHPTGDFELETVVRELKLVDQYLGYFESDVEVAMLMDTPQVRFAFHDIYKNPIRIWIGDDSFRIYSAGQDGVSNSGGKDLDDIWTGEPKKAVKLIHESYFDAWNEANQRNLWTYFIEHLR